MRVRCVWRMCAFGDIAEFSLFLNVYHVMLRNLWGWRAMHTWNQIFSVSNTTDKGWHKREREEDKGEGSDVVGDWVKGRSPHWWMTAGAWWLWSELYRSEARGGFRRTMLRFCAFELERVLWAPLQIELATLILFRGWTEQVTLIFWLF